MCSRSLSQSAIATYAEGVLAAGLYGATSPPASGAELEMLFHAIANRLEPSDIVFEFLGTMGSAPILPLLLRPAQHLLIRAAVDLTPPWVRTILGLEGRDCVRGKPRWFDKLGLSRTASFWNLTRPFRPVGRCAFRTIICISTAAHPSARIRFNRSVDKVRSSRPMNAPIASG